MKTLLSLSIFIFLFGFANAQKISVINNIHETNLRSTDCPTGNEITESANDDFEQQVLELLNDERESQGRPPLKNNTALAQAARYHAADMAANNYFGHNSQDGNGNDVCSTFERIATFYNFWTAGENIAAAYFTPQDVMAGWIESSGHYENIISTDFREVGIGYGYNPNADYQAYWVQDFGTTDNIYPIVINKDYANTDNRNVTIYLYGSDVFTEMRLKNDNGTWTPWQAFDDEISWELSNQAGSRTVSAELKKATSEVVTSSDEIELSELGVYAKEILVNGFKISHIFPNPVKDGTTFFAITSSKSIKMDYTVLDVTGKMKFSESIRHMGAGKQYFTIDCKSLSTGIYFVIFETENSISAKKIIVQ